MFNIYIHSYTARELYDRSEREQRKIWDEVDKITLYKDNPLRYKNICKIWCNMKIWVTKV